MDLLKLMDNTFRLLNNSIFEHIYLTVIFCALLSTLTLCGIGKGIFAVEFCMLKFLQILYLYFCADMKLLSSAFAKRALLNVFSKTPQSNAAYRVMSLHWIKNVPVFLSQCFVVSFIWKCYLCHAFLLVSQLLHVPIEVCVHHWSAVAIELCNLHLCYCPKFAAASWVFICFWARKQWDWTFFNCLNQVSFDIFKAFLWWYFIFLTMSLAQNYGNWCSVHPSTKKLWNEFLL